MTTLVALLVVGGLVVWFMTPEERARTLKAVVSGLLRARKYARDYKRADIAPFDEALRARRRWVIAVPALIALHSAVFLWSRIHGGDPRDPVTLVAWGASLGPLTTNGEWWRLLTAIFVSDGLLALLLCLAVLVQIGPALERLIGPLALLAVYLAGGLAAGLTNLWIAPLTASTGGLGATFALYGLLLVVSAVGWWRRSAVSVPVAALQRFAPLTGLFLLYTVALDGAIAPSVAGLGIGLKFAALANWDVAVRTTPLRRLGIVSAGGLVVAVVACLLVRGIVDVRPEIERLVTIEQRTATTYQTAVDEFRKGRISASDLADLIDRVIRPELTAAEARISALEGVPHIDEWRVADARDYLRLRSESWRLRAEGLRSGMQPVDVLAALDTSSTERREAAEARHRATRRALGQAESTERESLAALERIQAP